MRANVKTNISIIAIFMLVGLISFFFVPTHDDLINLSNVSVKDAFNNALEFGNGRFLGNTMVAVCLNNVILDSLFRTLFIGGIVVLSAVLVNGYQASSIWISFFLFMGIGFPIFRQCFTWGHGFYNYVPPVFWMLVVLWIIKTHHHNKIRIIQWLLIGVAFMCAFVAQLHAENSTTVNIIILIFLLLLAFLKKQKIVVALSSVSGAVLGAACMFLGPHLLGVGNQLNEYRGVSSSLSGLIGTAIRNGFEIITVLSASWGIWLVISCLFLIMVKKSEKSFCWIYSLILVAFPVASLLQGFTTRVFYKLPIDCLFAVYLLCLILLAFKLFKKEELKILAVLIVVVVISIAQLLVVSPIGPRCLFVTATVLVLAAMYIFSVIVKNDLAGLKFFVRSLGILSGIVYCLMLTMYIQAWMVHCVRMDYAQEQLTEGKTQIKIIELPYEWIFHCPNDSYVYQYTFNHGDKNEMSFEYISYREYCETVK